MALLALLLVFPLASAGYYETTPLVCPVSPLVTYVTETLSALKIATTTQNIPAPNIKVETVTTTQYFPATRNEFITVEGPAESVYVTSVEFVYTTTTNIVYVMDRFDGIFTNTEFDAYTEYVESTSTVTDVSVVEKTTTESVLLYHTSVTETTTWSPTVTTWTLYSTKTHHKTTYNTVTVYETSTITESTYVSHYNTFTTTETLVYHTTFKCPEEEKDHKHLYF